MPLLGYTLFRDKILSGEKKQTIRKLRKRPIKLDERLYHYWHLRQKDCEKLGESDCTETFFIRLTYRYRVDDPSTPNIQMLRAWIPNPKKGLILIEGHMLDIAKRDGFDSVEDMVRTLLKLHHIAVINWTETFQVIRWDRFEEALRK